MLEIGACRQWLERETVTVQPAVIIALGATAARAIFGREMKIGVNRGRMIDLGPGTSGFITIHPSALLRIPDEQMRAGAYRQFVADLEVARGSA